MPDDLEITGCDPELITDKGGKTAFIRCQIVEFAEGRPHRSGKYIHLQLTPAHTMRLLAMLQAAQAEHGWPAHRDAPRLIDVPRAKDRN